jgi:hypothetical protein
MIHHSLADKCHVKSYHRPGVMRQADFDSRLDRRSGKRNGVTDNDPEMRDRQPCFRTYRTWVTTHWKCDWQWSVDLSYWRLNHSGVLCEPLLRWKLKNRRPSYTSWYFRLVSIIFGHFMHKCDVIARATTTTTDGIQLRFGHCFTGVSPSEAWTRSTLTFFHASSWASWTWRSSCNHSNNSQPFQDFHARFSDSRLDTVRRDYRSPEI